MIPHQMDGQVAHTHDCTEDVLACEFDHLDALDRFARAFA